ncbi:uncharacterized protein LOC119646412 [Hermetia illucens]|nr:uncharacterized protein LOC119646412 [Hermetia illucens]
MDRKTGAIKKTIVRNVEVPPRLSENRRSVVQNFSALSGASSSAKLSGHDQRSSTTSRLAKENLFEQSVKYKVPQVNTSEKLIDRIERIQTMNTKKEVRLDKLTPRSKAVVSQEITKKLNFPPDQPIFKNLIPINVNDSLLISSEEPKPFRKKYVAKTNKDPVPELSDFLTPIPPLEHVIPLEDKPLIQLRPNNDFYKSVLELHLNFHPDS